jgi:serine/threonine protein kinase/outer membrane protein assembly factor BamD (BamD/ComL family)
VTGQTVAHYRLVAKISEGAGAVVYHAHDLSLGREVVLKLVARGALDGVARFQHEARAISSLNHPNICTIYEIGEHDGWHFLALELLDGEVLTREISRGPLAVERLIDLAIQIADALAAAHEERIVHRDLKPANIFVTRAGRVKLLDFGVALLLPVRPESGAGGRITTSAAGTIPYMSPEQAQAEALDHRSDLFSLGIVLYEMATGRRPFVAPTAPETLSAIATSAPPAPAAINPRVPADLERIIAKALEKKPALRYQTASDVRTDLQRLKRDLEAKTSHLLPLQPSPGATRSRLLLWCGGLVASVLLAAAAWLIFVPDLPPSLIDVPAGPVPASLVLLPPPVLPPMVIGQVAPASPAILPRAENDRNERRPVSPAVDELAIARQQIDLRLYDQAIETLKRSADSSQGRQAIASLFLTASIHETRGDIANAMSTYVEIATRFPDDPRAPEAQVKLAQTMLKSKRADRERDALRTLNAVIEKYPNSAWAPRALLIRAELETKAGAFERDEERGGSLPTAAVTYRRITQRYPASECVPTALQKLAALYVDAKRFASAVAVLEQLGARDRDGRYGAWFAAAEIYEKRLKDPEKARAAYARVPPSSPRYAEAQKKK